MRAIALYRVSTDKQDLAMQETLIKDKCKEFNLTIIDSYHVEDVSAYSTPLNKREDLMDIIDRATNKKDFDVLVVYLYDRLIRREDEAPMLINLLMNNGIRILEAVSGTYLSNETMEDKFMNYFRFWTAENESAKISRRVKDAKSELNAKGKFNGGVAPFGYELFYTGEVNKKGRNLKDLRQNELERKWVLRFFELYTSSEYGFKSIAKQLNNEISEEEKKQIQENRENFKGFRYNSLCRMVQNSIYCGYPTYNKFICKRDKRIYVEEENWKTKPYRKDLDIIGKDLFDKAYNKNKSRSEYAPRRTTPERKEQYKAFLLGKIYCSCGRHLTLYVKNEKRWKLKTYPYYSCKKHNNQEHREKHKLIKTINEIVINEIDKYFKSNNLLDGEVVLDNHTNEQIKNIENKIINIKRDINSCTDNINKINKAIDEDVDKIKYYIPHLERNEQQQKELYKEKNLLEVQLSRLKHNNDEAIETRKQAFEIYQEINWEDFETAKDIVNLLIDKIVVDFENNKVTVVFKYFFK